MSLLSTNCWCSTVNDAPVKSPFLASPSRCSTFINNEFIALGDAHLAFPPKTFRGFRCNTCSSAKKSERKSIRNGREAVGSLTKDNFVQNDESDPSLNSAGQNSNPIASRSAVLQACTTTSCLIAALGIIIRQVSHIASMEGLPVLDCSTVVSFDFEMWHLELIIGLVVLISSCRFLLLKTWTDFSESSEAANQQVLTSLEPLDYMVVAFLPGISEELLFRGALVPLLGMNLISIGVVALIFGVLHLGGGRKYSFSIWATFVGLAYGYATILSSSIVVPMASHALNNLIGGLLWRYTSNTSE
ncbi:CAAX amino terminal protease [Senna tora]|uniref:CAAX amino terminal protease n=1 Tax=Senna tora TaxID=362788 RepID=A0A834W7Z6_9FABA|nr:CAAX amino terminal protease [Senna tora]